jgi:hypothetical protein
MSGRRAIRAAIVVVLASLIAWAAPGPASAGHGGKDCGVVSRGAKDYRVNAKHMKCKAARKGSVKYLRSKEPRSGFDCAPTAGGSFYCQDPPKAYWGTRL